MYGTIATMNAVRPLRLHKHGGSKGNIIGVVKKRNAIRSKIHRSVWFWLLFRFL
jgi:hypothetical protein